MRATVTEDARFLAWAVGAKPGEGYRGGHSDERLLKLCFDHRVAGRLLARLKDSRPDWVSDALLAGLEEQQAENLKLVKMHSAAFKAIRDRYLTHGEKIISMKGLACFAYTGNPDHVRRTLDIDILVDDPETLAAAMRADKVTEYRNVSPHEIINARIEGVGIDLHAHYPIWSLDGDAAAWQGRGREQGDAILHRGELQVSPLTFDDLADQAFSAGVFGVEGVHVPDPSIAVLIICAHCFRDFMSFSSITVRAKPTLKFGDLAEMGDYLSQPGFSPQRLLVFADKTHATQAVRWMAGILLQLTGDDRLATALGASASSEEDFFSQFPRAVWGGFFARLPDSFENFIAGKIPTAQVVSALGGLPIDAQGEGRISIEATGAPTSPGGNTHILDRPNTAAPAAISIRRDDRDIAVVVEGETLSRGPNTRVHIDIAGYPWEWNWDRSADRVTAKKSIHVPEPRTVFEKTPSGFRLEYHMDPTLLDLPENGEIPGLVGVGEFEHTPVMRAGTLVPFVIR